MGVSRLEILGLLREGHLLQYVSYTINLVNFVEGVCMITDNVCVVILCLSLPCYLVSSFPLSPVITFLIYVLRTDSKPGQP